MTRVLLVDDDQALVRALSINLKARGYHVDVALTGALALALASNRRPDVVVLDLGLPDLDGIEVLRGLRGWTRVPVLVLSARDDQSEKVAALDAGADDYVTKPFGMDELLARLRAAVRRGAPANADVPVIVTEHFTVDLGARRVTTGDGELPGTPRRAEATPAGGVGPDLPDREQLPARLHRPATTQTRTRTSHAGPPAHRTRTRVPLRAMTSRPHPAPTAAADQQRTTSRVLDRPTAWLSPHCCHPNHRPLPPGLGPGGSWAAHTGQLAAGSLR